MSDTNDDPRLAREALEALAEAGLPLSFAPHFKPQQAAFEAARRTNQASAVLEGLSRQAIAAGELRGLVGQAFIAPLIVIALAYFALVALCVFFVPSIESMYVQVGQPLSRTASVVSAVRDAMPIWAVALPLVLLAAVVFWRFGWQGWRRFVPGAKEYAATVRHANFASQLALLLESGQLLEQALPLAVGITGDEQLLAAANSIIQQSDNKQSDSQENEPLRESPDDLPPLLRWCLGSELSTPALIEILRFAEVTYRQKAAKRLARWRFALPATIGGVVGGLVVLAYGLSLFGPFTELLSDLSLPTPSGIE